MSDVLIPSYRVRPEKGPAVSRAMMMVAGGLLGSVLLVGAVAWGISRMGPRPVPVIEADTRPVRVRPENPGGLQVANQDELIFERNPGRRDRGAPEARLAPAPEAPNLDRLREQVAPPPAPVAVVPANPAPSARPAPATPAAPPAAAPAAATPPAARGGRHVVQFGALASEDAARQEWTRLQRRVPELAGHQPQVVKFEREGQPTLWRLRTGGFADAAAARAFCETARGKGATCVVPPV